MLSPFIDDGSGLLEAHEPMLVQAVVPEGAVKALTKSVLHRPGLDEVELHAGPMRPQEHGLAGELRATVETNLPWQAILIAQHIQKSRQALAGDRRIHPLAHTFAGVIIDNIEGRKCRPVAN